MHDYFKEKPDLTRDQPLILVAALNVDILRELARQLRKMGYSVISTPGGPRVVRIVLREQPDLILMDSELEGSTGIETCRILREQYEVETPMVFYCEPIDEKHVLQAYDTGVNDVIFRPCPTALLRAKIKVHLQDSRSIQPATLPYSEEALDGETVLPAYKIMEKIGTGATGTVYRAVNKSTSETVAVKVIRQRVVNSIRDIQRFFRGSLIGLELSPHPNIVQIHEIKRTGETIYQVMEYIPGRTLLDIISDGQLLTEDEGIRILESIGKALDHLHRHEVLHRDVKPGNIFVLDNWEAKLGDMGISRRLIDRNATSTGHVVGTPGYLAPEQVLDTQPLDIRADLFSLGLTLYHALSGNNPFLKETAYASMLARIEGPELQISQKSIPHVSETLINIISKLIRRQPSQRYTVPSDLLEELKELQRSR
jgi:serine/threonine protein kinase/CheY-like chemotaxis protein